MYIIDEYLISILIPVVNNLIFVILFYQTQFDVNIITRFT